MRENPSGKSAALRSDGDRAYSEPRSSSTRPATRNDPNATTRPPGPAMAAASSSARSTPPASRACRPESRSLHVGCRAGARSAQHRHEHDGGPRRRAGELGGDAVEILVREAREHDGRRPALAEVIDERAGPVHVVRDVEEQVGAPQRAGQQLEPRSPPRLRESAPDRGGRRGEAGVRGAELLERDERHGGVLTLRRPRQGRRRRALDVVRADDPQRRADLLRPRDDDARHRSLVRREDGADAGLEDARLLAGYRLGRSTEPVGVVHAEMRHDRDERAHDVRRVHAPAETRLHDRDVHARLGEREEGGRGQDLEVAGRQLGGAGLAHAPGEREELPGGDRSAADADALARRDEMRRRREPRAQPCLAQGALHERAGRSLAPAPGDVHDAQAILRIAEPPAELRDDLERPGSRTQLAPAEILEPGGRAHWAPPFRRGRDRRRTRGSGGWSRASRGAARPCRPSRA
jgi:hypothetical protein